MIKGVLNLAMNNTSNLIIDLNYVLTAPKYNFFIKQMSENILDYTLPQHSDGSVEHELHDDE
jgi:hypothetical protein